MSQEHHGGAERKELTTEETEEEAEDMEVRMAIAPLSVRLCALYGGISPHSAEGLRPNMRFCAFIDKPKRG